MRIGTRVYHLRYSWMRGFVVPKLATGRHVMVVWDHNGGPTPELPEELRATPVQP